MKNDTEKENDIYKTSDLALATALALTYPIDTIDKETPKRSVFIFSRSKKFDDAVESYWRNEMQVEPIRYFNQLKMIKARIYSIE